MAPQLRQATQRSAALLPAHLHPLESAALSRRYDWPEMPKGGDVSDWLAIGGHSKEGLVALIESATLYANGDVKPDDQLNENAEIERLARLSILEFERERKTAADKLNVRPTILEMLVKAKRLELGLGKQHMQGSALNLPAPEPWPHPVDGAELLDNITATVRRYIVMPEHTARAVALWCIHAYLLDCFVVSPRLAIRSAVHRCEKTTLLEVISCLALRVVSSANVSAASIFRVVEAHRPTLLIDEADTFLLGNEDLRGILNSGHRKSGSVIRMVDDEHETRSFSTYGACAIALIGKLPATLHDRSAPVVDLKRRLRVENVESFRLDRTSHLNELARKALRWAANHAEQVGGTDPELPAGLFNRDADNWRPLLAISEVAGDKWSKQAREAAAQCCAVAGVGDASQLELLLADIRDLFMAKQKQAKVSPSAAEVEIPSKEMLDALGALEGHPWAEMGKSRKPLSQNRIARMLSPLNITPDNIGPENARVRGYKLSQFEEAFDRYLEPLSSREGGSQLHSRTECDGMGTSRIFEAHRPANGCAVGKCERPNNDADLCSCADANGGSEANYPASTCRDPEGTSESAGENDENDFDITRMDGF